MGWKGLINDPHSDGTSDINYGLRHGAQLAADTEQYGYARFDGVPRHDYAAILRDLISWGALARGRRESRGTPRRRARLVQSVSKRYGR